MSESPRHGLPTRQNSHYSINKAVFFQVSRIWISKASQFWSSTCQNLPCFRTVDPLSLWTWNLWMWFTTVSEPTSGRPTEDRRTIGDLALLGPSSLFSCISQWLTRSASRSLLDSNPQIKLSAGFCISRRYGNGFPVDIEVQAVFLARCWLGLISACSIPTGAPFLTVMALPTFRPC